MDSLDCFKAYDVRGRVPGQLNEAIARRIGRAFVEYLAPGTVVVGHDVRHSGPGLSRALISGLTDSGAHVIDIGECGTEEVYFATSFLDAGGGIMVTASHNPKDYNGMKLVREKSRPVSGDSGLHEIKRLVQNGVFHEAESKGTVTRRNLRRLYVRHLLDCIDVGSLKPLKIVCNAGNGNAGPVIDLLEQHLPFEFIKVHHAPDGDFPNGVPNPLLEQNRAPTVAAVRTGGANLGLAWDGDFDRCFFFDENGRYIEGYYIVGLLAGIYLREQPGAGIVHDTRLTWNTMEIAGSLGGRAIQCKTGHAFMKERLYKEDAVYGGEMSAHHYFRDFFYCDSGMLPWLRVVELMAKQNRTLSQLVARSLQAFPASGEINSTVEDPAALLRSVEESYGGDGAVVDHTDGLSVAFADWRFNLRMSNTEPLLRLNVESRGDEQLLREKTRELLELIRA